MIGPSDTPCPVGYDEKFSEFLKMIQDCKAKNIETVVMVDPRHLGDTHGEVIESLSRIANADLTLRFAHP